MVNKSVDNIWIEEMQRNRHEIHWWQMRGDGTLTDLVCNQSLHHLIIQHRSAQISIEQTQILFSLLNEDGFFDLSPIHSPSGMSTYEGDILVMITRYIGRSHRVLARPPDYYPYPLQRIGKNYLTLKVSWVEQEPAPWYWRAEIVTRERAAWIRSRGLLTICYSMWWGMTTSPRYASVTRARPSPWTASAPTNSARR